MKGDPNDPVLDILLATYNGAAFLGEQLDSVEAQNLASWRLLVRDDGSTDDTAAILEAFRRRHPSRVFLISGDPTRLGARGSFSSLLEQSTAPYFSFCDQDDLWDPDKCERLIDLVRATESEHGESVPVLVHSDLRVVDRSLKNLSGSFWRYQKINPMRSQWNHLLVQNVVTGCACMGNAALRSAMVPIPYGAIMHDWWAALIAAMEGRLVYLDRPTLCYRQHESNDTGAKRWGVSGILRSVPRVMSPNSLKEHMLRYQTQADALINHLSGRMPGLEVDRLRAFRDLAHYGFCGRISVMLRYQILKTGWLRNLALLARL